MLKYLKAFPVVQVLKDRLGHREKRAAKAVAVGLFSRVVTLVTSFVSTALLVTLLGGKEGYGLFVTISTVVGWIQLGNLGFGLGLQNNLIVAVANHDAERQRRLIATTQLCLLAICAVLFLAWASIFLFDLVSWTEVINASKSRFANEVNEAIFLSGCLIIVQILLSFVAPYYIAHQILHRYNWWVLASQIAAFAGLLLAVASGQGLVGTILLYQGIPMAVLGLNAAVVIVSNLSTMLPRLQDFSRKEFRSITATGMAFMVIMITGTLQYGLDNIIISRTFSPAEVTPYNLVTKLFTLYYTLSSIIFTPLWGAFGNAFASNDLKWIRKRFSQIRSAIFWVYAAFFICVIVFGQWFIRLWVGPDIHAGLDMIILIGIYYMIRQWMDLYSMLINAINAVGMSATFALPHGIWSAVCMYYGAKWGGVNGMVIGMSFAFLTLGCWLSPLIARRAIRAADRRE